MTINKETWTEELTCDLNEEEIDERRREVTKAIRKLRLFQGAAKDTRAKLKTDEDEMQRNIDRLTTAAETGREERAVECYESPNLALLRIETFRMDTGEMIRARDMDADERKRARQGKFSFSEDVRTAHAMNARAQEERKKRGEKVTKIDAYAHKRALDKADEAVAGGIEGAKQRDRGPFANEVVRDPNAPLGSASNPTPIEGTGGGSADNDELEVAPGAEPEGGAGTAESPTPIETPPPDERH